MKCQVQCMGFFNVLNLISFEFDVFHIFFNFIFHMNFVVAMHDKIIQFSVSV